MGKYLKKFETTSQYNAYTADTANFIKPNVSLITETNTVEYNPWVETTVVAKYNVTESTMTQIIMGGISTGQYSTGITTAFTSVYVDGNEIEISAANANYTFDTVGEHIVKYELEDPTTIKYYAFNKQIMGYYTGVTAISITIPNSVTSIGSGAFRDCTSLTSVTIPNSVTSIGQVAFSGCTNLTSITIPNSVTSIDREAFYNCTVLTSINIPNSVTSIGYSAFYYCSGLTSCTIGNGVTSIGYQAFKDCTSLTSCTIGSGVTNIGESAFRDCSGLTSVTIEATTPPTLGTIVFKNTNDCPIYVPSGSVETYKSDSKWSTYADRIQAIP